MIMKLYERVLTEGPGAGYEIKSWDFEFTSGSINKVSISKLNDRFGDYRLYGECDLSGTLGTLEAESYFYTTGEIHDIPINCSRFIIYFWTDELKDYVIGGIFEELPEDTEETYETFDIEDIDVDKLDMYIDKEMLLNDIKESLDAATNTCVYGGGYSHSTYDGTITEINEGDDSHIGSWFDNARYLSMTADVFIDDDQDFGKEVIKFVDKAVQGENGSEYIIVCDEYDEDIADFDINEENEAIEYAKSHENAYKVLQCKDWEDVEGDVIDMDTETIWERD